MNIPEFNELIQTYDIVSCVETKLDDLDIVNVDNFVVVQKNRKQKVKRKSGGKAVMIKKNIYKHFEYVDTDCEYVLWFKLDKALFQSEEDVYFRTVYIPPAYTDYNQSDILEQFYQESESFTRSCKYVYLLRDFNARTSALSDITTTDDEILRQIGVNLESVFMSDSIDMMSRLNIDINRVSKDSKVNTFGKKMIDFCKNNDMLILNGRAFGDKGVGKPTCKDKSVVDYVICSSSSMMFLSTNSKLWFNNQCRQAQKKYHLARRIYNINKTHQNQEEVLATSRNYKPEINKSITYYKRIMRNKLMQM